MPFGQLIIGPPGSGKSTYCAGLHQFLTAFGRPVQIINLDPANYTLPYPCALNIADLITLEDVMREEGLGPNGAMLYCMEYLEQNLDWLVDGLKELDGDYFVFDVPGQVELSTNHNSLTRIMESLRRLDYRLAAVHLTDSSHIVEPAKYISILILSLRTMLQLEMPHINVLTKMDILRSFGTLDFDLAYYTEVQDLSHLSNLLERDPRMSRFSALNSAICELVEDFGLVTFSTLAVEDKKSMMTLTQKIDRMLGYVFLPSTDPSASDPSTNSSETHVPNPLLQAAEAVIPGQHISDVQERWIDEKEAFDQAEEEGWKEEGRRLNGGKSA